MECQPSSNDGTIIAVMQIQHGITLIILLSCTQSLRKTVELAHPMYGLLYQEMIVIIIFVSMNTILLFGLPILTRSKLIKAADTAAGIYMVIDFAALQFHQVNFLCMAIVR